MGLARDGGGLRQEKFIAEDLIDFKQYIQLSHNTVYTLIVQMPPRVSSPFPNKSATMKS